MYFWIVLSILLFLWGVVRDRSRYALAGIMLFLFIAMGFYWYSFDFNNYLTHYENFQKGIFYGAEPVYSLIFFLGGKLIRHYEIFKLFLTAALLFLLYRAVRRATPSTAFVFALYLIFPAYLDGDHTRFFIGSCAVTAALLRYMQDYADDRDFWRASLRYACGVVIGTLCHISLAAFIIVPLVPLLKRKVNLSYAKVLLYSLLLVAVLLVFRYSGLMFRILSVFLSSANSSKYQASQTIGLTSQQFHTLVLHFFRQFLRLAYAYFLLYTYKTAKNRRPGGPAAVPDRTERILGFLVTFNCIAFLFVVFMTFSVNFDRLNRIICLVSYVCAAICLNEFPRHSVVRWRVKLAAFCFAMFFAVEYFCQSDYYITEYKLIFLNNIIFNPAFLSQIQF